MSILRFDTLKDFLHLMIESHRGLTAKREKSYLLDLAFKFNQLNSLSKESFLISAQQFLVDLIQHFFYISSNFSLSLEKIMFYAQIPEDQLEIIPFRAFKKREDCDLTKIFAE